MSGADHPKLIDQERPGLIVLERLEGARRREILWQFLLESVFLTSAGGLFGILVGSESDLEAMDPALAELPEQERKLIELAYAFEQATKWRKPPQFRPTAM